MNIKIVNQNILDADVQAIVNPANSFGYMGGGLAAELKDVCGQEVEDEVVHVAPIPIGHAVLTSGGARRDFVIIHSPTMEQPAGYTDVDIVRQATQAALECAEENNIQSIAFPGMGTGIGELPKEDVAKTMLTVLINFEYKSIKRVVLCAINQDLFDAFEKAFGKSVV